MKIENLELKHHKCFKGQQKMSVAIKTSSEMTKI